MSFLKRFDIKSHIKITATEKIKLKEKLITPMILGEKHSVTLKSNILSNHQKIHSPIRFNAIKWNDFSPNHTKILFRTITFSTSLEIKKIREKPLMTIKNDFNANLLGRIIVLTSIPCRFRKYFHLNQIA